MGGNIDIDEALLHVGGDEAFLVELAELFLDGSHEVIGQLREAASLRQAQQLERAAHTLRGRLANFHAASAATVCGRVEVAARRADWDTVAAETPRLFECVAAVCDELKMFARH